METPGLFKLLITSSCLHDLKRHLAHKDKYDAVIERLQRGDDGCARHAVRSLTCSRFKVFESTITGDLRLCWSYASHFAEPSVVLWALDGHDSVFRRLSRITGERFKVLQFESLDVTKEQHRLLIGSGEFEWRGVRPPTLLELSRDEALNAWVSEHLALSEEQSLESVRDVDEGPVLLSGGGGSGKTTLLINLLLRQLEAGERPLLVTYHDKLAEYCKRLIGDSPLREEAVQCIKTIDELLKDVLVGLGLTEHLNYISQAESKELFVRNLPDELKEPAWAEFRGMWKGRVDVEDYAETQRQLEALKTRQTRGAHLTRTAEGVYVHMDELTEVSEDQAKQMEKERFWRERPTYKIPNISAKDAEERAEFYKRERAYRKKLEEEQRGLSALERELHTKKRDYHLSSKRYGRDVRFIEDESIIKGAITAYESQLAQKGGDRLNACLEVLCQAQRVQSSYTSLLIDEVQDFTRLELQLLSLFMPNPKRWVIAGDENQIVNPSGFKWERVKEVIFLSANRLSSSCKTYDPLYLASQELLGELKELNPVHLSVNYRNPAPIKRLAQDILSMKREGGWGEERSQRATRVAQADFELTPPATEEEASREGGQLTPEESPWAWRPQSTVILDPKRLYEHVIWLSKSVPSFCLIVFSQKEKIALIERLKERMKRGDPAIDFERVLTPLEVKGLEFDLVIALSPPLPTSDVEGIRDFEFNQLYVSATRARTSLAYLWSSEQEALSFYEPLNQASAQRSPQRSSEGEQAEGPVMSTATWASFIKLSHLHFAHDSEDWAKSASLYALQGQHKMAAELYRVGGFYRESAELLEQIGDLEGAIRDFQEAQMPQEQARCEAKLAEQKGQLRLAFEAWERYAQLSGDCEGMWRTLEGGMSEKQGLKPIAHVLSSALMERSAEGSLEENEEHEVHEVHASGLGALNTQARLKEHLERLSSLRLSDVQRLFRDQPEVLSMVLGEEPSKSWRALSQGRTLRQLRDLRQSPHAGAVYELTRSEEVHEMINPPNPTQHNPQLSIADLELLLGAGSYYEQRRDREKRREELSQASGYPWSSLPRGPGVLYEGVKVTGGLPRALDRYGSLTTANRVMWETKLIVEEQPALNAARRVIRTSHQNALDKWGDEVRYTNNAQQRGLLRLDREVAEHRPTARALFVSDWRSIIERSYQSAGLGKLIDDPLGSAPAYTKWSDLETRVRRGLDRLVAIMGQLRLSHSPTRLYTAQRFAELWTSLMLEGVGHWLERPAIESLTYLEDEVIERLSSCSMSELRSYLSTWEASAWRRVKATPLPETQAEQISTVQKELLQHLMGLWSMGQALFMRGTWASFINEKLKLADQLTAFGYVHLRAANSHWVGLTLLPLHGVMAALTAYEDQRVSRLSGASEELREAQLALKASQRAIKERRAELKSLSGQQRTLRVELKRLSRQSSASSEAHEALRDRELVEEQLRLISTDKERVSSELERLERDAEQLEGSLEGLRGAQAQEGRRLKHLKEQRDFFEWALCQADSLARSSRRLSDEDYREVRASWRTGREWSKLIFDVGEQELLVFLTLLNRYRARQGLKAFSPEELHFHDGARRSGAERRGGESLWLQEMGNLTYSSPLNAFLSEGNAGELPSAGATLSFAIEQGYTPLILELFEDSYYLERAYDALLKMGEWRRAQSTHEGFKRELGVLCATPMRVKSRWLEAALFAGQDRLRPLLTSAHETWVKTTLRKMRDYSDELPLPLEKGARRLLTLWSCLSEEEQARARVTLFELARLWPSPLGDAIEALLIGDATRLNRAYQAGERWLLLSPLSLKIAQSDPLTSPQDLLSRALLWVAA